MTVGSRVDFLVKMGHAKPVKLIGNANEVPGLDHVWSTLLMQFFVVVFRLQQLIESEPILKDVKTHCLN